MRIEGPRRPAAPAPGTTSPRAGEAGFSLPQGEAQAQAPARAPTAPAAGAGLDALIALQMGEEPGARRRRGIRRGRSILDALDQLKLGLLQGQVGEIDVMRLMAAVEGRERDLNDPALDEVLDAIELRARVELAKIARDRVG